MKLLESTLKAGTIGVLATLTGCGSVTKTVEEKPNIIYILADDLGYGDLSCYGQKNFSTPNIDKLAASGMLFTQHYAGCTVCAPSRSALLTGQHTGHTPVRGNMEIQPEGQHPLPANTVTIAKLLKGAGYKTAAFGKWGLGFPGSEGSPNNQGFDEFLGYNCQRLSHHYYPWHIWNNDEKMVLVENEGQKTGIYAPILIHERTLAFIEENKDEPFFLYVPSLIPHAEMFAPEEYMERFRGKFLPEMSYHGVDSGRGFRLGAYGSQPEAHAAFAAMITLLDEQVGEILDKVKELGLEEKTIIIFSSDNGPHREGGADPDYFDSNGTYTGYKRDLTEGGIRVPMIASWPGKIKEGSRSDLPSAFWDMFPTFAQLAGVEVPENIDGISILPTLLGEKEQKKHEYLYWEFHEGGGKQAVLYKGKWKGIRLDVRENPDGPIALYNVVDDPAEQINIADTNVELVTKINEIMSQARTSSEFFNFGMKTIIE